jgi:hypothetical protein
VEEGNKGREKRRRRVVKRLNKLEMRKACDQTNEVI